MNSFPSNQPNMAMDITSLITLLVTEIRDTLNTKIDILNEKIDLKNEENRNLKEENGKLKEIIAKQEQKLTELTSSRLQQTTTGSTVTTLTSTAQQNTALPTKSRGIRSHNLIITCPESTGKDPKTIAEEIFTSRFHRKPSINSAQFLITNTRGSSRPVNNTRGSSADNGKDSGATAPDAENQDTESKTQKILITLHSIWEAKAIYRDRVRALKNTGIYIAEDLNKDESSIFYQARQLRKSKKIESTWTENGDTFIREQPGSPSRILQQNDPILDQLKTTEKNNQGMSKSPTNDTTEINPVQEPDSQDKEVESSSSESSVNLILNTTTEPAAPETRKSQRKAKKKKNYEDDG